MSDLFYPSQDFQGNQMNFLRKAINYKFIDKVELKQSKFYLNARRMCPSDVENINKILEGIRPGLKISDTHMNSKSTRFFAENDTEIVYSDNRNWSITIIIQGYKVNAKGAISPVWRISTAKLV